jgi:hypothetical protein
VAESAVSTTSLEVSPWCTHLPAGGPIAVWTTSTNAATSWSVTRSRSFTAATKALSIVGARSRTAFASSSGTTPSAAHASVASTSTSSHTPRRDSSVKSAAISGSE